jgi:OOP family OmpA-OmpF porin
MKKIILAGVVITGIVGSISAFADDSGWYVAGGFGGALTTPLDLDTQNTLIAAGDSKFTASSNNGSTISSRVQAGYQINSGFAVEAGYVNLGNYSYSATGGNLSSPYSFSSTISASYFDAVGIMPLGATRWSVFGKVGVAHTNSTSMAGVAPSFAGASRTGFTSGVGIKYEFANGISIQYEADNYDVGLSAPVATGFYSLGFKF